MARENLLEVTIGILVLAFLVGIPFLLWKHNEKFLHKRVGERRLIQLYAKADSAMWTEEPLLAADYAFQEREPLVIQAKLEEPLLIRLTSIDVHHSFSIPQLRVGPFDVAPGKWTEVELEPDEPGTYSIICYTICGPEHEQMVAKLEVLDEEEE